MEDAPAQELKAAEVAKRVALKHRTMLREALQEAHRLFAEPVHVTEQDRLHGLGGILERRLSEARIIGAATSPQKKNRIIRFLEKNLQELGHDELKKLGFGSGTVRVVRAGEVLDLSVLDERGWVRAIR